MSKKTFKDATELKKFKRLHVTKVVKYGQPLSLQRSIPDDFSSYLAVWKTILNLIKLKTSLTKDCTQNVLCLNSLVCIYSWIDTWHKCGLWNQNLPFEQNLNISWWNVFVLFELELALT